MTKEEIKELNKLKKVLKESVKYCKKEKCMDSASWGYEEGIIITGNDAVLILKALESKPK